MSRTRVLVVDDSPTFRAMLRVALGGDDRFEVIGVAADGEGALKLFRTLRPELIILDVEMPGLSGIDVTRRVMEERPTPNSPLAYQAVIAYRYEYGGEPRTGSSVKRVDGPTSHRKRAERLVEEYPVGRKLSCWVDPDDPEVAILKHNTLAPLYSIWFPGLFVVAGLGIAINSVRRALA